ncbi:acyl-CoA dehydrogenase family protein [Actinophytocola algeriensis]|uniref:Acyl-CoA dehydrogenase n=1 Tax=Actinophytocola algeriensis TaxID=1768010 RepID=A0A7W7VBL3_9PSEU|nr:acyl-CoA dehydrogenase family protein [Actinophytocola algeriensis]MBB4904124.1 acyl-CoA dehydrogenase [Actinophytocola algeriensis]MBE1477019.1 acyl-CoA dehydrogenase [Actinophytocola algeriensis]
MDFSFSDECTDLAELARTIVADHLTPVRLAEVEATGDRFDRALWTDLAKAGVLSAALPESVGGSGLGLLEQCAVLVELGRAVAPVPYLCSIVQAASAIAEFGTDAQRAAWAAPAAAGALVLTAALSEEVDVDPARPATTAERASASAQWHVHGSKVAMQAGPVANLFLVPAETALGLTVFLITPTDSGVTVRRQEIVDGDVEGLLELDDVVLGDDRVLGEPGGGSAVVDWLTSRGTVGLCALQAGVSAESLQMTAKYATGRVQFDRPIATFQAVGQRLADCYIDVEAIRLTLWQAAWRLSKNLAAHNEIATAKFWAADGGHRIAHAAVHIHGGVGIDVDYPLHRYFVATKRIEFTLGGATTHLRRIGTALAAEPA